MTITVIAPALYPSEDRIWHLKESARQNRIDLHLYGMGEPFRSWIDTHVTRLIQELKQLESEYVLFVDAADSIFTAPLERIHLRYRYLDSPKILMSEEKDGLNCGGWLADREVMLAALSIIEKHEDGNPQVRWRESVESGEIEVTLDSDRLIFYAGSEVGLQVERSIPFLSDTSSAPCVAHLCGGYSDPYTGKDYTIIPFMERLGYDVSRNG